MLPREARQRQGPGRPAFRPLIRTATALAAVGVALAVAGCGSDSGDEGGATGASQTRLQVTLEIDGPAGEAARTETISCEPGSGCGELEDLTAADFEPVPPETACTEIYGGPETARIGGTLNGEPVEAELSRANGCEIERFDRFTPLLQALFAGYEPGASLVP